MSENIMLSILALSQITKYAYDELVSSWQLYSEKWSWDKFVSDTLGECLEVAL